MDYSTLPLFALQPETKEIPLTRGKVAIVDAADYEWLMQWKWHAHWNGKKWYAQRTERVTDGTRRLLKMHRVVMGITDSAHVDHKNGNGLNNRRDNLRSATPQENGLNRSAQRNNKSGYKGVFWHKQCSKWTAKIQTNVGSKHLGLFLTPEDAARAYDAAAIKFHGDFAWLNFP